MFVSLNRDVSYPLSSPHNKGFHVKVCGTSEAFFTEMNVNDIVTEDELIEVVNHKFDAKGDYVMISKAQPGETFAYDAQVYDRHAIEQKSYSNWDDDLEDLEDNAQQLVKVFLNDQLRWEVENQ